MMCWTENYKRVHAQKEITWMYITCLHLSNAKQVNIS